MSRFDGFLNSEIGLFRTEIGLDKTNKNKKLIVF